MTRTRVLAVDQPEFTRSESATLLPTRTAHPLRTPSPSRPSPRSPRLRPERRQDAPRGVVLYERHRPHQRHVRVLRERRGELERGFDHFGARAREREPAPQRRKPDEPAQEGFARRVFFFVGFGEGFGAQAPRLVELRGGGAAGRVVARGRREGPASRRSAGGTARWRSRSAPRGVFVQRAARVTNASAEATASTSPAGAPPARARSRLVRQERLQRPRVRAHRAVATANPHAIGVNARSASKRVVGVVAAPAAAVEAEALERRSRDCSSAETTAPSQKHAAASISETTRQHAGKDADSGADVVRECRLHASATVGTERRHSCRKYRGSLARRAPRRARSASRRIRIPPSHALDTSRGTRPGRWSSSEASRSMRRSGPRPRGQTRSRRGRPRPCRRPPRCARAGTEAEQRNRGHASGGAGAGSRRRRGASGAPRRAAREGASASAPGGGGEGAVSGGSRRRRGGREPALRAAAARARVARAARSWLRNRLGRRR